MSRGREIMRSTASPSQSPLKSQPVICGCWLRVRMQPCQSVVPARTQRRGASVWLWVRLSRRSALSARCCGRQGSVHVASLHRRKPSHPWGSGGPMASVGLQTPKVCSVQTK